MTEPKKARPRLSLPPTPDRLTRRESFAAFALAGLLASDQGGHLTPDRAARLAAQQADALEAALAAPHGEEEAPTV
ncbi:hypothetical protein QOL99_02975 [Deinococcus sp. MIMF12]|uniref:Uncharacterized protein n=1 Tax=Deinococcus rhizophilus TaxID=3049544 RepID=A0ABT7JDH1_9DEIO|nr:hypothetical protein [Deinococcus rhizophilus]MDL2343108.1 hypothetical protein [Deinococcus rhizophilus]